MTICALLLDRQCYARGPSRRLAYGTLGLLFVNVSIGGTLTQCSAPPGLMVAARWQWDKPFMLAHFGLRAVSAICVSSAAYWLVLRQDLAALAAAPAAAAGDEEPSRPAVPAWIIVVHLAFMAFTVAQAHHPTLFVAAFLFFLGFASATSPNETPRPQAAPSGSARLAQGWSSTAVSRGGGSPRSSGASANGRSSSARSDSPPSTTTRSSRISRPSFPGSASACASRWWRGRSRVGD
jgi:hypothetical protein